MLLLLLQGNPPAPACHLVWGPSPLHTHPPVMPAVMGVPLSVRNFIHSLIKLALYLLVKGPAYEMNAAANSMSPVSTS